DLRTAELELLAGGALHYARAVYARFGQEFAEGSNVRLAAKPQLARTKIRDDRAQTANVVLVRVAERDRIEPRKSTLPQVRRNHLFAIVELAAGKTGRAPSIHQQRLAERRHDKQRVALTDVERGELEHPGANVA